MFSIDEMKERIAKAPCINVVGAVSDDVIAEAAKQLDVCFPRDYQLYLRHFGAISTIRCNICGLGIVEGLWLHVVTATKALREAYPGDFPHDAVMLMEEGDDCYYIYEFDVGIVLWRPQQTPVIVKTTLNSFIMNEITK